MKIKLYKVDVYQAYRADECGVRFFTYLPSDTEYYKHALLEVVEKELPKGITFDEIYDRFDDNGYDCQMFTNEDGSVSLVSALRIFDWF